MKSIGITRRVDELGRIVIPKEIRSNLKIKSSDCLEVFISDNKIIMKKKDLIENAPDALNNLLQIISKLLNVDILITDTDKILYVEGNKYKKFVNKELSKDLYNIILRRESINKDNFDFFDDKSNLLLEPIIVNGDILGSVILLNDIDKFSRDNQTIAKIISNLLINHLEV